MLSVSPHILRTLVCTAKAVLFTLFFSGLCLVATAQNTKGDRPGSAIKKQNRESRFKPKSRPGKERAGQSYRPAYRSSPRASEKSFSGNTPRKRVAVRSASSAASRRNVYSQRGTRSVSSQSSRGNVYSQRSAFSKPKNTQRAWIGSASGSRIKVRSATAQVKKQNVYTKQGGSFRNFQSRSLSPTKKATVTPRSASRSFMRSKSLNPYAGFFRVKRKGEQYTSKDIAGRTVRGRNYRTPAQAIILPEQDPYRGRKRVGDRSYKGPAAGYHKSATATKPKAWTGDIAGRKIRGLNYESPKRVSNKPIYPPKRAKEVVGDHARHNKLQGSGYRTFSTNSGKVGSPIPVKTPGRNSGRLSAYQNKLTGRKPIKGGGSVSGKGWNNNAQPIPARVPGIGAKGVEYSGNLKANKPLKGGGSVSGKLWNNNGQPVPGRPPSEQARKAGSYPGNFKKFELYPSMSNQGEEFTGFLKRGKYSKNPYQHADAPLKKTVKNASAPGGLQVPMPQPGYARNKNAHEDALLKRDPGGNVFKTDGLQIKVPSPGYVQNKNAHENSILKRKPSEQSYKVNDITVKIKQPGWVRNKNAHESALLKRDPGGSVFKTGGLQIKVESPGYAQNKKASEESILKRKPSEQAYLVNNLTVKMKQPGWVRNKNAHEDALMKRDPGSAVFATDKIYGRIKAYTYKSNPSANDDALKVREPGKAFAKANNYQGNIKMQKFNFFKHSDYHPDASYVKTNKNNVKEERDVLTNFRLFWAKLFRKSENQPDHLKEKIRKPRYDTREIGLWND